MNYLYFMFLFVLCIKGTLSLDLTDITVPSLVVIDGQNDTEPITMDCVYQLEDDTKTLVVKWLKDDKPIYQWIFGKDPIVFRDSKDTISAFSTSSDENKQYRGIQVQRNIDASGTYKCVVYTADDTESMEKKLQVIDIEHYAINVQPTVESNETRVECTITNIYPRPILELLIDDNDTVISSDVKVYETEDGYYNSTLVSFVNDDDDDGDEYKCIAKFAGINFTLTTSALSNACTSVINWYCLHIFLSASLLYPTFSLFFK